MARMNICQTLPTNFSEEFDWAFCCCCNNLLAPRPGAIIEITKIPDYGFSRPVIGRQFMLIGATQDALSGAHIMVVSEDLNCFEKLDECDLDNFIQHPHSINIMHAAFSSMKETEKIMLGMEQRPSDLCRIIGHSEFLYQKAVEILGCES